ncbi:hypothetical protein BT63DRAFT_191211 [Microthyrium microscopicum]|uniref:Folliculin-interacting protein N-terminal domain-containing protein n=1 Tax=Microthyrium microscopicum TaxID=703497 RepID=A0A6A6UK99_9PEZI|nr:hypothetical protein BT63DRAFT_191211 [Microthyrium microscopicum]
MLGQLLHSLSSSSSRRTNTRNTPLDSAIEDTHTQALLFPASPFHLDHDGQSQVFADTPGPFPRASTAYGDLPGHEALDLEFPRDIRILIAQAASHGSMQPELLFDSKPPPASESPKPPPGRHSRAPSRTENISGNATTGRLRGSAVPPIPEDYQHHRRTSSAFSTGGAIERARMRRSSISSAHSGNEVFPEQADAIEKIALGCMFENAASNYKGMSNKVHIVPLASKPNESTYLSQSLGDDLSAMAKTQAGRKPSSLSRSMIPGDPSMPQLNNDSSFREQQNSAQNTPNRRTVLVTRTFSITWVDEEPLEDQKENRNLGGSHGRASGQRINLPHVNVNSPNGRRQHGSRTFRSPMYAVTLVLQLPIAVNETSPPISRTSTFGRKTLRKDSSSHSHVSLGSSFESDRKWQATDPFFGDSFASMAINSDVDDRVDLIGQHWDILSRTLSTLQSLAQKKILETLKSVARIPRPIRLAGQALAADMELKRLVDDAALRIIRGMKIPRVQTGHNRWPAWRDEARRLGQWAGGREENFLLLILITAFLGTHTEWLQSLAPRTYRRRFREQQKLGHTNKLSIPSRTVIISSDKMAARRLIFLLAVFLPPNQAVRGDGSPLRPSTSASYRAYSQSPPSHLPLSRQESLRRTINRRAKSATSRTRKPPSRTSSITAGADSIDDRTETSTIKGPGSESAGDRRPSDARSVRTKLGIVEGDASAHKSTTTTSSITPQAIVVKPHFARVPSFGPPSHPSHSRNSSTASATLLSPIQRTASSESQNKAWSLRNLWGSAPRRGSASEYSDVLQTTDEGLGIVGVRAVDSPSKLQQMVDETHGTDETLTRKSTDGSHLVMFAPSPELRAASPERSEATDASRPIDVPLKMSLNKEDGVIDVEIPFADFGSPAVLSPAFHGDHSGSSYGESSLGQRSFLTMSPKEPEHPMNVGGWLDKLHPDFTLQAVKPYPDVLNLKDIKAAMSAEPNPPLLEPFPDTAATMDRWLDVCTTLIVDTDSFTVKRIKLRRLVRFVRGATQAPPTPSFAGLPLRSQYGNPYQQPALVGPTGSAAAAVTELTLDETFPEERVADTDRDFIEVVERVIGLSTPSPDKSHASSSSSRSSSCRGRPTGDESRGDDLRDCKRLILGSLEAIVAAEARGRTKNDTTPHTRERLADTESTLRDGIRRWLDEVDSKTPVEAKAVDTSHLSAENTTSATLPMATTQSSTVTIVPAVSTPTGDFDRTPTPSHP